MENLSSPGVSFPIFSMHMPAHLQAKDALSMILFSRIFHPLASVTAMVTLMGVAGMANAQNHEASLERGAHGDATPQQRYQSAIREAGGGLKLSLAECRSQAAASRKSCESNARANYKQDMDMAREMRKNPDARPYSVKGGEVRMTGETPIKP